MLRTRSYLSPNEYLDITKTYLEERELDNNLILGLCDNLIKRDVKPTHSHFVNILEEDKILATSINTISKAIIASYSDEPAPIQKLVDYYLEKGARLSGVFGEKRLAEIFSGFYPKEKIRTRNLLAHQLSSVNKLSLTDGDLGSANEKDLELLSEWTYDFYEEAMAFPKKSRTESSEAIALLIRSKDVFVWRVKEKMVSMAVVARRTTHLGIVGMVYTPPPCRGKGFATACVSKLSEYILNSGSILCGLFTDQSNPVSNAIYKRIGYEPKGEFSDIEFE